MLTTFFLLGAVVAKITVGTSEFQQKLSTVIKNLNDESLPNDAVLVAQKVNNQLEAVTSYMSPDEDGLGKAANIDTSGLQVQPFVDSVDRSVQALLENSVTSNGESSPEMKLLSSNLRTISQMFGNYSNTNQLDIDAERIDSLTTEPKVDNAGTSSRSSNHEIMSARPSATSISETITTSSNSDLTITLH